MSRVCKDLRNHLDFGFGGGGGGGGGGDDFKLFDIFEEGVVGAVG